MISTIWGSTKKPVSSERLARLIESISELDGYLFIGYPIIGTPEGPFPIDALLVSSSKGLILFNLVEGPDLTGFEEAQDESANKLESKLRNHKTLMRGRTLLATPETITFAPLFNKATSPSGSYKIANEASLVNMITPIKWEHSSVYEDVLAAIESISTIKKNKKKRTIEKENSRGSKLKRLEDSIANLDNLQGRAVLETVDGVQRIRGLAGSGKTIVLALKAAYLHAIHPDWKIAVTFHTRSLKGQFRRLINTFVIEHTNEEPDWSNLKIIHAWGAPGTTEQNGIYYNFCKSNEIEFYDYSSAKHAFGRGKEFRGACLDALKSVERPKQEYDAILVDEAQDFSPEFLRLCYKLLRNPKRLVYAYDELQNLSGESLPSPEEIFGTEANGQPIVRFEPPSDGKPRQDIILEKCYRNSRPVLATAHALGFGIYREPDPRTGLGLIQMFDHHELWSEVGYSVLDGELQDGNNVTLGRLPENSPIFLENHSPIDDLIQFHSFLSSEEQEAWLASSIINDLNNEELEADDIIVINPDPLSTRTAVGPVRQLLFEKGIKTHLAGVDTSPDVFFDADGESVAFTGIFRAKGNEAGIVYIMNAQDCFNSYALARGRNQLFTAITRSKAWVRILGFGPGINGLIKEFEKIKDNDFKLTFKYPTQEQRKHLTIVNRDMSQEEERRVKTRNSHLYELVDDLENQRIFIEDLPEAQIKKLKRFLGKGSN